MNKMKFLALSLVLVLSVPTLALAIQTNTVDVTRNLNKDTVTQVQDASLSPIVSGINSLMDRYTTNFRTCEPLHIQQSIDLFGLKASYQIDINGWKDNKCSYYMTGGISALGNDIREVFKITASDELIAKIKPIVQCNFTQEQLNLMVDTAVEAQEKKLSENSSLTNNKNSKEKQKLTPTEEKLVEMFMSNNVCTVPNQAELMQNLSELMGVTLPATTSSPSVSPKKPAKEEVVKPILRQEGPKVNMPSAPQF